MNKSNPRTVLKKIVLLSYTLSMIVFSCIVIGFSKDLLSYIVQPHLQAYVLFSIKNIEQLIGYSYPLH